MKKWLQYLKSTLQENKLEVHEPNYEIIDLFIKYLPPEKYPRVLELGAGAGIDMNVLRAEGYSVTGVGFGEENIKYAEHQFGLKIVKMDMHDLSFPSETFDAILAIQVFEHSLSPFIVASEISRVLKEGGRFFLDTPDPDDESMWSLEHPALLYPKQLKRLFSLVDLKAIADLSRKHRTQIIFEKKKNVDFIGDDNINWDEEARRAAKEDAPFYEDTSTFDYFKHLLKPGMRMLDLGCNISKWNKAFKKLGLIYEGLDASPTAIKVAKERFPENTYYLMNADKMNFHERFDLIFTHTVLQHTNIETKKQVIPKVREALKSEGLFVIQEKSDVDTKTTFVREKWISFIESYGFAYLGGTQGEPHGFIFRKRGRILIQDFNFDVPQKTVIDVGSGSNPKKDATILVEKNVLNDFERGGISCKKDERPMIIADIEFLPFQDKVADFIYATHILEHVAHPNKACKELIRVGKAGYIEAPHPISEQGANYPDRSKRGWPQHKWYVWNDRDKIVFKRKDIDDYCHCRFGVFVRDLIENSLVQGFDNYVKPILDSLKEKRHTELKWENSFRFQVV